MTTYYVTQEEFDLIEYLKAEYTSSKLKTAISSRLFKRFTLDIEYAVLPYLGNDKTIKFKIKDEEKLYYLARIDAEEDHVYMRFNWITGSPEWTMNKKDAFKTTFEEIEKWLTPAWEIKEVEVQ